MKRRRNSAPAIPKDYMSALGKLYGKPAQQGPFQPLRHTQPTEVLPPYPSHEKSPCRERDQYSSGPIPAIYLQETCPMNRIHDEEETAK